MNFWVPFGLLGQLIFGMRFVVQWIYSEKKKRSYIPIGFWYLSICGGVVLLIYAIHRKDPVFIIGQGMGLFIYIRNLILIVKRIQRVKKAKGIISVGEMDPVEEIAS